MTYWQYLFHGFRFVYRFIALILNLLKRSSLIFFNKCRRHLEFQLVPIMNQSTQADYSYNALIHLRLLSVFQKVVYPYTTDFHLRTLSNHKIIELNYYPQQIWNYIDFMNISFSETLLHSYERLFLPFLPANLNF